MLTFIVLPIFKNQVEDTINIASFSYVVFFLILYYGLKTLLIVKNIFALSFTLLIATGTILFAYLVFAIYHCYFQKETLTNFFIPNKSIFSILLASQLAFVLPLYLNYKSEKTSLKIVRWFLLIVISTSVLLLALTQGRAGWLGLMLALSYIAYQYLSGIRIKRIILFLVFPVFLLLTLAMFLYKSDSSNGRLLIYKISARMLKDNWLLGIGHGQFKVRYNEYQAAYFASHNIDSKEALLADNTFYAFNDFFQGVIENGVIAFLILVTLIFLLVMQIKNVAINSNNKHLFTASVASLICILTSSLFSYPLQIFPIAVQAALCLSIINAFQPDKKLKIELSETGSKFAKITLILFSALLLIHFGFYLNYKTKNLQAFQLKRSGFKQKAIEKYKELSTSYITDGSVLYLYAQELYYSNQLTHAQEMLNKAKKHYSTNEVYKLSATIENELQNYSQAEKDYKTAIYMVPNRMISRNDLLAYYLERKDTANATHWTNSILNMPVKVSSQKARSIQEKAKETLIQISK